MMEIFRTILDFIFPPQCLGCARAPILLCGDCRSKIPILQVQRCPACETTATALGALCGPCRTDSAIRSRWSLDGLWVLSPYSHSSTLARLIKSLKYKFMMPLATILGQLLAERFPSHESAFEGATLVPIPLHPHRERKRGYNQALLLAETLTKRHGFPLKEVLVRYRNTPPQAQQPSRAARLSNLENAFSLRDPTATSASLLNKKFILIDDVCSTGATLNETAKVLKAAGAATVWGIVLARG